MTTATDTTFAIGVRYLTGYSVAASANGEPEWPPHPARLFMAMVAACQETGGDLAEMAALQWLEKLDPPQVVASECDERSPVTVYVPPNDFTATDPNILPQWRTRRQPRTFVRVRPHCDTVHFIWPVEPAPEHVDALDRLCDKITRIGHSSSLVQAWMQSEQVEDGERSRFRPSDRGNLRLRRVNLGTVDYLASLYREQEIDEHFRHDAQIVAAKGKEKRQALDTYDQRFGRGWTKDTPPARLRPDLSAAANYERITATSDRRLGCFDPALIVLALSPKPGKSRFRRLSLACGPRVCEVFRNAIIGAAPDNIAVINGHASDGSALQSPHLAIMPLPFIGGRHGDGHLLGVAAILPRDITAEDSQSLRKAVAMIENKGLTLGELGEWNLTSPSFDEQRATLRAGTWTGDERPSSQWATVTPISLDRHAKSKDPLAQQDEIAAMIRQACAAIALPEPVRVVPLPVSVFGGVPDAGRYPRLERKDGSKRRQTHALLWFSEPVVGPVLLGAGRYRGWGVCRPYEGVV